MKTRVLSAQERVDWLRLARTETVGPVAFAHLLHRYGSAAAALAALPALARRGGRASPPASPSREEAEAELTAGEAFGARLLASCESEFPPRLAALDPPPPILWAAGDGVLLARPSLAVVGARAASAAGQRFARSLAAELGEAGFVIVSGLARGIDAAAHAGALPSGTIAAIAGGIDQVFPPENRRLYEEIRERGALVSERRMGFVARAKDFPRRNRLVSGLALGVVVVEAELGSGSLITARFALEQGREVFAVPGSPLDPRARGANDLIRQGACLTESAEDVVRALEGMGQVLAPSPPRFDVAAAAESEEDARLTALLASLLSPTPIPIDEIARAAEAPVAAVLAALVELAIAGRAELLPGGLAAGLADSG